MSKLLPASSAVDPSLKNAAAPSSGGVGDDEFLALANKNKRKSTEEIAAAEIKEVARVAKAAAKAALDATILSAKENQVRMLRLSTEARARAKTEAAAVAERIETEVAIRMVAANQQFEDFMMARMLEAEADIAHRPKAEVAKPGAPKTAGVLGGAKNAEPVVRDAVSSGDDLLCSESDDDESDEDMDVTPLAPVTKKATPTKAPTKSKTGRRITKKTQEQQFAEMKAMVQSVVTSTNSEIIDTIRDTQMPARFTNRIFLIICNVISLSEKLLSGAPAFLVPTAFLLAPA